MYGMSCDMLRGLKRLRKLPDMPGWIAKACRTDAPRPIHRSIEQGYATSAERVAQGVYILDVDRINCADTIGASDLCGMDQFRDCSMVQQIYERRTKSEDCRFRIGINYR